MYPGEPVILKLLLHNPEILSDSIAKYRLDGVILALPIFSVFTHSDKRPNGTSEKPFMVRLTEQEQQEVIRHLEAAKPLPEKYRFLLFEDKRELELVWNGKTNEVCNVVLPFQTIEQVD